MFEKIKCYVNIFEYFKKDYIIVKKIISSNLVKKTYFFLFFRCDQYIRMVDNENEIEGLFQNKAIGSESAAFLEKDIEYAIRGISLNKTYSRREFYLSKSKNPKVLDSLNINVAKGKM